MRYSASKYSVTLKTWLGVVQGHWKWCRSIDHIRLSIGPPLYILLYLVLFLSYLTLNDISHVSTHLLIHLSAHLYYHHHFHHPSLLHSFTPGSKPTFSTNSSHLRLLLPTGLPLWQREWTGPIMLIVLFLVSHFNFLFVPCGGLSWLPVSFLLHVRYTL